MSLSPDAMNSNSSGWIIVKNSQVADGSADHCYMRASGDCFGSQNSLDSNWNNGTANWSKDTICSGSPTSRRSKSVTHA